MEAFRRLLLVTLLLLFPVLATAQDAGEGSGPDEKPDDPAPTETTRPWNAQNLDATVLQKELTEAKERLSSLSAEKEEAWKKPIERRMSALSELIETLNRKQGFQKSLDSIPEEKKRLEQKLEELKSTDPAPIPDQPTQAEVDAAQATARENRRAADEVARANQLATQRLAQIPDELKVTREQIESLKSEIEAAGTTPLASDPDLARYRRENLEISLRAAQEKLLALERERAQLEGTAELRSLRLSLAELTSTRAEERYNLMVQRYQKVLEEQQKKAEEEAQEAKEAAEKETDPVERLAKELDARSKSLAAEIGKQSQLLSDAGQRLNEFEATLGDRKREFEGLDETLKRMEAAGQGERLLVILERLDRQLKRTREAVERNAANMREVETLQSKVYVDMSDLSEEKLQLERELTRATPDERNKEIEELLNKWFPQLRTQYEELMGLVDKRVNSLARSNEILLEKQELLKKMHALVLARGFWVQNGRSLWSLSKDTLWSDMGQLGSRVAALPAATRSRLKAIQARGLVAYLLLGLVLLACPPLLIFLGRRLRPLMERSPDEEETGGEEDREPNPGPKKETASGPTSETADEPRTVDEPAGTDEPETVDEPNIVDEPETVDEPAATASHSSEEEELTPDEEAEVALADQLEEEEAQAVEKEPGSPLVESLAIALASILYGLRWPAFFALLGTTISFVAPTDDYILRRLLFGLALLWAVAAVPGAILRRHGVAISYWNVPTDTARSLRRLSLALAAGGGLLVARAILQTDWIQAPALTRLLYTGFHLYLIGTILFFLRRSSPFAGFLISREKSRIRKLWPLFQGLILIVGLGIVAMDVAGYRFGAAWFAKAALQSLVALVGLLTLHRILGRTATRVLSRKVLEAEDQEEAQQEREKSLRTIRQIRSITGLLLGAGAVFLLAWFWGIDARVFEFLDGIHLRTIDPNEGLFLTLGDLIRAGLTILVAILVLRNLEGIFELLVFPRLRDDEGVHYAVLTITRYTIIGIAGVMALGYVHLSGSRIQWFVAAMGVGLGFGLQEIVANFVSGILLLVEQPVKVGDIIEVGGQTGTVRAIHMRATEIIDWNNKVIVVPNKSLITGSLTNWTHNDNILRVTLGVGVDYGTPLDEAKRLLLEAVQESHYVMDDPAPSVLFSSFGDNALGFDCRFFVSDRSLMLRAKDDVGVRIQDKLDVAGIGMPFPQRDLHFDEEVVDKLVGSLNGRKEEKTEEEEEEERSRVASEEQS